MGRKKAYFKVGQRRWDSYKPGRQRLYQLQEVVSAGGGVKALSPYMTSAERKMFVEGWRRSGSQKKIPPIS